MTSRQLVEYVVIDIEDSGPATSRTKLADVQVNHRIPFIVTLVLLMASITHNRIGGQSIGLRA